MSTSKLNLCLVALFACLLLALPATAELSMGGNTVSVSGNTIIFEVADGSLGYDLSVTGPGEYLYEERFEAGSLMSWTAAGVADGFYAYELVPMAERRERGEAPGSTSAEALSGSIRLQAGTFANPDRPEKLEKDIQHNDDVIITFSLCVGNDCVNGESFGFDTLRLKENNLRVHFDDTSNSASFPSNDWRITINDSSNGGDNYFSIDDATAGRQVFRVDAGAPANSLRVDSAGDVGIGKSNPVVELHVVDGDSPTLRLEQDGSSGFTPQTFDLVSNEANFFIRDVTNGSQLPFRIKPGADTDALYIDANNEIGIGTNNPGARLHIRQGGSAFSATAETGLLVQNNAATGDNTFLALISGATGNAQLKFGSAASEDDGRIIYEPDIDRMRLFTGNTVAVTIDATGNMTIPGSITTGGGMCGGGCDLVFSPEYELPSIEEHAAEMWSNSYLPSVGPTTENEPFNLSEKTGGMLNELEKAHIYIEQLHNTIKQMNERLQKLEARESAE